MLQRVGIFLMCFGIMNIACLSLVYRYNSSVIGGIAIMAWLVAFVIAIDKNFGFTVTYPVSKSDCIEYWTDEGTKTGAACCGIVAAPIILFMGRLAVMLIFGR